MILGVTGHRPDKLGGYGDRATLRVRAFAEMKLELIQPELVLTGMALGWYQAIAQSCLALQIPFKAYVPFNGQERKWPPPAQDVYRELLKQATEVKIICPGEYASWKMSRRDQVLVHDCTSLLALFNGSRGGTYNTVDYAIDYSRERVNCWQEWLMFLQTRDKQDGLEVEHELF